MDPSSTTNDIDKLKQDVREGRIDADRLVELLITLQQQLQAAKQQIAELQKQLGGSTTAKIDQPYSMKAEEKRQQTRGKTKKTKQKPKPRRGRVTSKEKIKQAERTEKVFPQDVPQSECKLSH